MSFLEHTIAFQACKIVRISERLAEKEAKLERLEEEATILREKVQLATKLVEELNKDVKKRDDQITHLVSQLIVNQVKVDEEKRSREEEDQPQEKRKRGRPKKVQTV
jgi:uncharacterized coiled-coil protein SlyX